MIEPSASARKRTKTAVTLVAVLALLLSGCAPAGRAEACDAIRVFSRGVGSGNISYVELAGLTARLSDDLYAAARMAGNASLRGDIRYAAGAARDVTTVIRSRQSMSVISFEIDTLGYAIDQLRIYHC